MLARRILILVLTLLWLASASPLLAQLPTGQEEPQNIPPAVPPESVPEETPEYEGLVRESELAWGLDAALLDPLFQKAAVYRDYTRRFTCEETARVADYGSQGRVASEKPRRYGYLLIQGASPNRLQEFRQEMTASGALKNKPVNDEEPFPPAYGWVFLFSRFNEPYFAYRYLGDKFDGFDWVHEIEFQGSVPFTNGKDIRQWEGVALVDAVTFTPIEIRAAPSGQRQRIEAMYRTYQQGFRFLGMTAKPKPKGYTAHVQFRHRRDGLTFPTELRYDTFRAVSISQVVPIRASTRTYDNYQVTRVTTDQEAGERVDR